MAAMPAQPESTPLEAALARVGDRWSFLVVEALLDGSRRFNELAEAVPGIAPNILSDRLRRLERDGVLVGRPYQARPPRLEYELTADGRDLAGALRLLAAWGSRHGGAGEPLRHDLCGTTLEARWYCPTCARSIDGADTDEVRRF
jgi:DNA-binding HxlR family transcriptional regulator